MLRVVQLNAGTLLEPRWPERRGEIVAWLDRLEPDVICLEEIWEDGSTPNTGGWIADHAVGDWYWHFDGRLFGAALWPDESLRFGSAVLSRWPIDEATYHALPLCDGTTGMTSDIPWELLHVRTAGLDVFACHLAAPPLDAPQRRLQVAAVDDVVRACPPSTMPPILCGDFNAEPDSDEIRFLCGLTSLDGCTTFYQDAWRVAGDGPGYTQDWRVSPVAKAMNVPRKRIDYVFVGDAWQRPDGAGRVLDARLAFDEPITGVVASDHMGLVVDIEWPDRPSPAG